MAVPFWHWHFGIPYVLWHTFVEFLQLFFWLMQAGHGFTDGPGDWLGCNLVVKNWEKCALFFYVLFRVWYKNTLLWMFWGAGFVFKQDIIDLHWRLLGATDYSFYSNLTQDVILFQSGHSFIRYLSTVFFVMQRAPLSSTGLMQNDLLLLQKDAICFSNMFFVD